MTDGGKEREGEIERERENVCEREEEQEREREREGEGELDKLTSQVGQRGLRVGSRKEKKKEGMATIIE